MKIQRINAFFRKFGEFQLRHRAVFLVVICLVTVFCVAGLPRLTLSSNEEDWFDNTEQTKIDSDHFKDLFGADDSVMILVQADDVFAPDVLAAIARISERLENEIPYAKNVMSLTDLSLPFGNEEGFEIINPFEDGIPDDPAELQEKKDFILSRESLRNNLVSDDGKETWIILSLESYQKSLDEAMHEITPPAMKIVEEESSPDGSYSLKPTGMSYTEYEEEIVTMHEIVLRVGIGFVVMLLCLVLFVRSLRGVIVPIIATGGAIGSVLGLNGWLGITGDNTMVMLPILLSMALSVGYAIHYINAFRLHFRKSGKRRESVINSIEESGWPIFFTMVTTFAGLISFMFASIRPLRWVG
ncbi:MAG: MMPL family transporter, partial [Treponema sp.]|nr:MMPL family transporter [Treponema sp.]